MSDTNQNQMPAEEGTREAITDKIVARAWQDAAFKQQLLSNPKAVVEEVIGQKIPEHIEVKVVEETPNTLYLVLPVIPTESHELSEEQLEAVAGGFKLTILWTGACVDTN